MTPGGAVFALVAGVLLFLGSADRAMAAPGPPADSADSIAMPTPLATRLADGVWLIPGGIRPNRQPDGNTVMIEGPKGLIVFDTGRHPSQRLAIEAFAAARRAPIVAIVNSHWHLDHVSGNPALKRDHPQARVYASGAIDDALTGFLARSAADGRAYLKSADVPAATREDILADLATVEAGAALRPDVVIAASRRLRLGGRAVTLNLAPNAATAGDVWLFDGKSGVAVVGDLVTLPAAFLDTACPPGWKAGLDRIAATPFTLIVPGHGAPMTRAQFETYRRAFSALIDCAGSSRDAGACAAEWTEATGRLRDPGPAEAAMARGMTRYYVADVLRGTGGRGGDCRIPG